MHNFHMKFSDGSVSPARGSYRSGRPTTVVPVPTDKGQIAMVTFKTYRTPQNWTGLYAFELSNFGGTILAVRDDKYSDFHDETLTVTLRPEEQIVSARIEVNMFKLQPRIITLMIYKFD